jgi:hypothetical protein
MGEDGIGFRFARLEHRLLNEVRQRIANGELTERGLARRVEVSQPHIHNVLKGVRGLTTPLADRILESLGLSVLDLLTVTELGENLRDRAPKESNHHLIGFVRGLLSSESPFPDFGAPDRWVAVPRRMVAGARRPLLVRIQADEEVKGHLPVGDVALVETDETARRGELESAWYVLRFGGVGYLRQVRRTSGRLHLLGQPLLWSPGHPAEIPLSGTSILQIVRGLVLWVGPDPRTTYLREGGFLRTASS